MQSQTFKERLGYNTWQFLSTLIEGYPIKANEQMQDDMKNFIYYLAKVYPCDQCGNQFLEHIKRFEPRTCCREELYRYFLILRYIIDSNKGNNYIYLNHFQIFNL